MICSVLATGKLGSFKSCTRAHTREWCSSALTIDRFTLIELLTFFQKWEYLSLENSSRIRYRACRASGCAQNGKTEL